MPENTKKKPYRAPAEEDLKHFDQSLPISLLRAREAVISKFMPSLRAHDISPEQWRVIRALELEDGLELTELASKCFLLPPSLSRIARKLEQRKLIVRKHVATDQRKASMFLSAMGRELFNEIAPQSLQQYAQIREDFGAEKLEQLYLLLDELVGSINQNPKQL